MQKLVFHHINPFPLFLFSLSLSLSISPALHALNSLLTQHMFKLLNLSHSQYMHPARILQAFNSSSLANSKTHLRTQILLHLLALNPLLAARLPRKRHHSHTFPNHHLSPRPFDRRDFIWIVG